MSVKHDWVKLIKTHLNPYFCNISPGFGANGSLVKLLETVHQLGYEEGLKEAEEQALKQEQEWWHQQNEDQEWIDSNENQ